MHLGSGPPLHNKGFSPLFKYVLLVLDLKLSLAFLWVLMNFLNVCFFDLVSSSSIDLGDAFIAVVLDKTMTLCS